MNGSIRVHAFAKINLGLKVLGRRPDGYHELLTIYQTVSLADRLSLSLASQKGTIEVDCQAAGVPSGRGNLVYRAAALWRRARGIGRGIRVQLEKRIPAGAGLGGGSSDAAATLLALERLTGRRLSRRRLFRLAASLGSDVPLFLHGGRVLGSGRGEIVAPLPGLAPRRCLIVFPGFAIPTARAYRDLSLQLTRRKASPKMVGFGARPHFPPESWGPAENDFEQVVFAKWPGLARMKRRFIQAGAETASLTGSGSALYAVFDSAEQLLRAVSLVPSEWQVFRCRTISRPEYQRRLLGR